jgi:hypothetical protein
MTCDNTAPSTFVRYVGSLGSKPCASSSARRSGRLALTAALSAPSACSLDSSSRFDDAPRFALLLENDRHDLVVAAIVREDERAGCVAMRIDRPPARLRHAA